MSTNFAAFTQETAPALTDQVVGYRTATSGGERRILLSAVKTLFYGAAADILLANIYSTGDMVATGNASYLTWQGDANNVGRGYFVQREGTGLPNAPAFNALRCGDNSRSIVFDALYTGGSFASKTGTPSAATVLHRMKIFDGTNWIVGAQMVFSTTELTTPTNQGTRIDFNTILTGSTTAITAFTFDGSGNVILNQNAGQTLIGTTSTTGLTGIGCLKVAGARIMFTALPTSSAGLTAGTLWNDTGTVKIA